MNIYSRNTLICTVGTSLLGNLKRLNDDEQLKQACADEKWEEVAELLQRYGNSKHICGAEINSITSICADNLLSDYGCLILLVSDTKAGRETGKILRAYYRHADNPIQFREVPEERVIEGLNDGSVERFQQQGLKNLVEIISDTVRQRSAEAIAINATGGYKAQISFAGMIGQALDIPVYYLFERFAKVISLPPQPIALDLSLWLQNYWLFKALTELEIIQSREIEPAVRSQLDAMLSDCEDEDESLMLSAMGLLFHERCRYQFEQRQTVLLEQIAESSLAAEQKKVHIAGTHHGGDKLNAKAQQLCRSPYVEEIQSRAYEPHAQSCVQRVREDGWFDFVLFWTDPGYALRVKTTGRNVLEVNAIAAHLEMEHGRK